MLFREMTPTRRREWLLWARRHDWGVMAMIDDAGRMVGLIDAWTKRHANGTISAGADPIAFDDARSLHEWAGY